MGSKRFQFTVKWTLSAMASIAVACAAYQLLPLDLSLYLITFVAAITLAYLVVRD